MVLAVAVGILADVGVDQPRLIVEHGGISILELDLAVLGGFHLCTGEDHAGLEAVHEKIVMACLPVVTQDFQLSVAICQFFISTRGSLSASMSLDATGPRQRTSS